MSNSNPQFSVVTPSYNALRYLRRAHASVSDQVGPSAEHIVVDAVSSDGTVEWLTRNSVRALVEKDEGMYDAINKGLRMARGQIIAQLNCDEQYLPGTFDAVEQFFGRHPDVDLVYGDCLLTAPDGTLLSFRKAYPLRRCYVASWQLYVMTAAIFYRRRIIDDGCCFDKRFRIAGDRAFVAGLLARGYRARRLRRYLSAFTITGSNLSASRKDEIELSAETECVPRWARVLRYPLNAARLFEKIRAGAYWERWPLRYAVYQDDLSARRGFEANDVSHRWPDWNPDAISRSQPHHPVAS